MFGSEHDGAYFDDDTAAAAHNRRSEGDEALFEGTSRLALPLPRKSCGTNLKLNESCISNPKSEISDRTATFAQVNVPIPGSHGRQPAPKLLSHRRLIDYGARTTRAAKMLPKSHEGRYAEARAAESRADFVHKLRIVLKELNEATSWIEQIVANGVAIIAENQERCWIIAASMKTARGPGGPIGDFGFRI